MATDLPRDPGTIYALRTQPAPHCKAGRARTATDRKEHHMIRPGQEYESCDPRESIRLRIKSYTRGNRRALVTDTNGKRPRQILVSYLHETSTTKNGQSRRTGYRLVKDAPHA